MAVSALRPLVSVIAVSELAYVAMQIRVQTVRMLAMLTAMAAIRWLLGYRLRRSS